MKNKQGFAHIIVILVIAVSLLLTVTYLMFGNFNVLNFRSSVTGQNSNDNPVVESLDPINFGGNSKSNVTLDWKTHIGKYFTVDYPADKVARVAGNTNEPSFPYELALIFPDYSITIEREKTTHTSTDDFFSSFGVGQEEDVNGYRAMSIFSDTGKIDYATWIYDKSYIYTISLHSAVGNQTEVLYNEATDIYFKIRETFKILN